MGDNLKGERRTRERGKRENTKVITKKERGEQEKEERGKTLE